MNTVQFFHNRRYRESTFAVDINFTKQDLMELLVSDHGEIVLNIGKAIKHPDDTYCKKTGRDVASSKMEYINFILTSVFKNKEHLEFTFKADNFNVLIKTSNKSTKPHLIFVS